MLFSELLVNNPVDIFVEEVQDLTEKGGDNADEQSGFISCHEKDFSQDLM